MNLKLVYTSVQMAGYVGILTAVKQNAFSFSVNQRSLHIYHNLNNSSQYQYPIFFYLEQGEWWINLLYAILDPRALPLSFVTRIVMEKAVNFNQAVDVLQSNDLIAPVYFIVGGVQQNEGVVITRTQNEVVDVWRLDLSSTGIEKWYLLETNYDHWKPTPSSDDRRGVGMRAMNQTTQANINYDTLMDVLTVDQVCNR
jgi:hypothetical protein